MPGSIRETVSIADGVEMPRLGFGTYKAHGDEVIGAIRAALDVGYRGIDTAAAYANEESVGDAVRGSGVRREQVFLATKVWPSEQGYQGTKQALRESLARLGMDHVDLYLIHWAVPELLEETWRAMVEMRDEGLTRAVGVCNFLEHHLETLSSYSSVRPAINQFEFHPRLQQPELVEYCESSGITVQAWAPIMRGRVLQVPELVEIGERHGKSAVQVTLRWILQRDLTTIPKSVHEDRIRRNADVFDFELSAEEMRTIDSLDAGKRLGPHPDKPPA